MQHTYVTSCLGLRSMRVSHGWAPLLWFEREFAYMDLFLEKI